MYYLVYLLGVVYFLANGIGSAQRYLNFADHISLAFVLGPCVLVLFCTGSFRAFGRGVAHAFGKRDDPVFRLEESLHAVRMVMETAAVSGGLAFLISTVNVFRGLAPSWAEADGMVWLLLDLSVALLPLFYLLVVCMVLLPPYYMLKKHLSGQEHGAGRTGRTALKEEKPAQSMKCVIVRDLLQNCAEGMVSDGTAEDIRNHLQECCCRAFLESLEKGESAETAD